MLFGRATVLAPSRWPKAPAAEHPSRTRSAGWRGFSTVSAVPTGYPRPTSVTGTKIPASVTRSALKSPHPTWPTATPFLLWGHNPSSTSLILAHDIVAARKRGMKIVAVDPRRVGIASQADVLLRVRPGTDGALALALIDVVIKQKLYDEIFVRQWTNGFFLTRVDSGRVLTEAELKSGGFPERFVAWDEIAGVPVVYDPSTGSFDRKSVRPALTGEHRVFAKDGDEILCRPVFSGLAKLAARYSADTSAAITWVPADH